MEEGPSLAGNPSTARAAKDISGDDVVKAHSPDAAMPSTDGKPASGESRTVSMRQLSHDPRTLHGRLPSPDIMDFSKDDVPDAIPSAHSILSLPGMTSQSSTRPHYALDTTGQHAPLGMKPRVTATLWENEGIRCYQVEARGVTVARREDNDMINGTKLLNVAGMTRGRRDGILKSEKTRHTVKVGPMHLKGVWIPYERALDLANREIITELLYPLFVHDIDALLHHPSNPYRSSRIMATNDNREQEQKGGDLMSADPTTWEMPSGFDVRMEFCDPLLPTPPVSAAQSRKPSRRRPPPSHHWISRPASPDSESPILPMSEKVTALDEAQQYSPPKTIDEEDSSRNCAHKDSSPSTSSTLDSSEISSSGDEGDIDPIVAQKQILLERLMEYFHSIISISSSPTLSVRSRGSGTSGGSTNHGRQSGSQDTDGGSGTGNGTSISTAAHQTSSNKRSAEDREDDGQGGKRPRIDPRGHHDDLMEEQLRFACPFFKRNPEKYHRQKTCPGPGWNTVHRVKEHVYRSHSLPISCPICHETFENDRLKDEHLKRPERCEFREPPVLEGMDATQKEQLRCRKKSHKSMTEAEKWNKMYLILFPSADPLSIPSPYYEYAATGGKESDPGDQDSEFVRYEQFLRRELPVHVRRELEIRIDERLHPLEEGLRGELVGIVRDMQLRLLDIYKARRSAPATDTADVAQATGGSSSSQAPAPATGPSEEVQNLDNVLQPFQPPPYLENVDDFDDFDGLLFDMSMVGSAWQDSGFYSDPSHKDNDTGAPKD